MNVDTVYGDLKDTEKPVQRNPQTYQQIMKNTNIVNPPEATFESMEKTNTQTRDRPNKESMQNTGNNSEATKRQRKESMENPNQGAVKTHQTQHPKRNRKR